VPKPGTRLARVSFLVGFHLPRKASWAEGCDFFIGVYHLHIAALKARVAFCSMYSGWLNKSSFRASPAAP